MKAAGGWGAAAVAVVAVREMGVGWEGRGCSLERARVTSLQGSGRKSSTELSH